MTLKDSHNHYNIKFLKGYGFSIKVKNSKIILKNIADPFKEPEVEEWFVNNMPYEKIVMSGKGYISTEALDLLSQHHRNLILLDVYGRPITYLNPVVESLTNTQYRIGQYDTFRDESKRDYLSRQIVKAKLDSQINFLKSTNKSEFDESISKLESIRNQIGHGTPILLEKNSATIYFKEYKKLIPKRFEFHSRNNVSLTASKRNATDVINVLLNYGYTVLAGEISKFINGIGLDAYYGFYRKNGVWKQRGFGKLSGKDIEHLETFEKDGKLFYKIKVLRNSRLRNSIIQNRISEIGKIKEVIKQVNLNADRKRFWLGEIERIDSKTINESMPISLNFLHENHI